MKRTDPAHLAAQQPLKTVVMGVSGCGKSTLAVALSQQAGWAFLEGDDFHSDANRALMKAGTPLNDDNRKGWLLNLGTTLASQVGPAVATCSALKRQYRDLLRKTVPGVRFVFLHVAYAEAVRRGQTRGGHFFNPSLVNSQFATLERPRGEFDVCSLDGSIRLEVLITQASAWLRIQAGQTFHAGVQAALVRDQNDGGNS